MIGKFGLIRIFSKVHAYIYRISLGTLGGRMGNVEFMLLTTVGKKSAKMRSVPLAAIPHKDGYIVVASYGGSPVHPYWLDNIRNNPNVKITIGFKTKSAIACIINPTDGEYERMWTQAISTYRGFNDYKRATSRAIPIVAISPK